MNRLNDNLLRKCAVILLAVLAVAVYIWCFDSKIDLNGDNATYISLARNLASGQGYSDMAYGGAFVPASQFPPGYPFLLSLMVRLGLDSIVAFKILNGVLLMISLLLVFLLFRGLTGSFPFACLITLLCLAAPRLVRFATIVMSETGYMTFILLAFFALWRVSKGNGRFGPWFWVASVSAVASYYFRGLGISVMAAVIIFFLFRKEWLRAGVSAVSQLLLILPWTLRNRALGIESRYLDTVSMVNPWRPEQEQVGGVGDFIKKAWVNLYDTTLNGFRRILFPGSCPSWDEGIVWISVITGIVILAVVVYGLWRMKPLRFALLTFLAANIAIFMAWHSGNDFRYAVPYIPIIVSGFWYGLKCLLERCFKNFNPAFVLAPLAAVSLFLSVPELRVWHRVAEIGYPEEYVTYFDLAQKIESINPTPGEISDVAICCRKPELFHYFAPSFYCCNYPYTSDTREMAKFFLDRKIGLVVVDMFGYSSTDHYLLPAITGMQEYLSLLFEGDDHSLLFAIDLQGLASRYGDGL
ncbi:MAG: hypothetical protein IKR30_04215 [Bacteroidales bacterium]|nr:hypothetical protein [Bacteroidales bacterium]